MTDGHGRTVDFTNTMVIMTSNVGSQWITELGGKDRAEMEKRVYEALKASFRPEFLNRVDETIIFDNLTADQIGDIVAIQMERVRARLAAKSITLTLDPSAVDLLASLGYDPVYGARPLKRAIQKHIENPLSLEILEGKIPEGTALTAIAAGDRIVFDKVYGAPR
jgi:ATP-dependent Clp protease ATP-binding subunit ClpB